MRRNLTRLACFTCLLLFYGVPAAEAQQLGLRWLPREDLNISLPSSIRVYEANGKLSDGARVRAVYATVDLRDRNLKLRAVGSNTVRQTTKEAYDAHHAIFAINGGYFSGKASVSVLVSDGVVIAPGPAGGVTRGAFGMVNGKPEIVWPYAVGESKALYKYPDPNLPGNPEPTAASPGAQPWQPSQAMGAGPVLVKAGKIRDTSKEEGFGESHLKRHPRTAIGYRDENTLLMMVVDGRQLTSAGVTIIELAQIMLEAGCYEAVNLDGGGSSAMVAAGEVVNIPVDKPKGNRHSLRRNASALVLTENQPSNTPEIIYIDTDSRYYSETGQWESSNLVNYYGSTPSRLAPAAGPGKATYRFDDIRRGKYQLGAWWTVDTVNVKNASYILHHGNSADTLHADQRDLSSSGRWNVLGDFKLSAGDYLELVCNDSTGNITADAIRLVSHKRSRKKQPKMTLTTDSK